MSLGFDLTRAVEEQRKRWDAAHSTERLWGKDASLWTGADESDSLGWLTLVQEQLADISRFKAFAAEIVEDGFSHIVLLGVGGSSIAAEVFSASFGKQSSGPKMLVLDSTDPAQIRALRAKIDPARTLFCVSSKSGTTLEPNLYLSYFFEETRKVVGEGRAGHHFVAITDPATKLEQSAQGLAFRRVYHGTAHVSGSYSVLSDFGLIPFAGMGLDTEKLLKRTERMVHACQSTASTDNPGVMLGLVLATAANQFGRDKVTLLSSPSVHRLGAWLEQLLGESTATRGLGLIPVDREGTLAPQHYGKDRLFVYLHSASDGDPDKAIVALEKAGQPVVRIVLKDLYDLGQTFFLWQMATAVAGSMIGVNPFRAVSRDSIAFDMPEAQSSPVEKPILDVDGIKLFTDRVNAEVIRGGGSPTLGGMIRKHLDRVRPGDYLALLAYLPMFPAYEKTLQEIRIKVLEAKHVATVLAFGPRFLHSAGEVYKHGPNSGVFLQITGDDVEDLPTADRGYTFGQVKARQAQDDFQALAELERRVLRIHLGKDVEKGLARLRDLVCASVAH
jgi:glucose-6-phosphate isomerase